MTESMTALAPLASVPGELRLVKESWLHSDYTLQGTQRVVAALTYGITGNADASTSDGTWTLSRVHGLVHHTIDVTDGSGAQLGRIELNTWSRGGALELAGATYEISAQGFFEPRWTISRDGAELVVVQQDWSLGSNKGSLEITDAGRADAHAVLLTLIAVHAVITHQRSRNNGAGYVS